jgi:hypothetical protein
MPADSKLCLRLRVRVVPGGGELVTSELWDVSNNKYSRDSLYIACMLGLHSMSVKPKTGQKVDKLFRCVCERKEAKSVGRETSCGLSSGAVQGSRASGPRCLGR